jgi:hypothetical protein
VLEDQRAGVVVELGDGAEGHGILDSVGCRILLWFR